MNPQSTTNRRSGQSRQRGLSLIELLVAMTISAVLIFGATQVYVDSRSTYATNEEIARLQETARYAMSAMEADVRMANYWGLTKYAYAISPKQTQTTAASALETQICGTNFAVDLEMTLQADNGTAGYTLGPARTGACNAFNNRPQASDTLTVRRASAFTTTATVAGVLRICSNFNGIGQLQSDTLPCSTSGQGNDLSVNAYYIDRDSDQAANVPSLRRKGLQASNTFADIEVVAGVEDMQVQFGIDPTGGTGDATHVGGTAQYYVDPMTLANWNALLATAQVVSVRIWLLIRADAPEIGFVDGQTYVYGDRGGVVGTTANLASTADAAKAFQPSLNPALSGFRRLLVSRTIQLRNAIGT
jgi:type IV pilus assembly protein PilW